MDRKWVVLILFGAILLGLLLFMWFSRDDVARIDLVEPAIDYITHGPRIHLPPTIPKRKSNHQSSRREEECRATLEEHFGLPFESTRNLSWLTNPETNHRLKLDGYNDDVKIAFEYNGVQHYEYPNHLHKNEAEFIAQKRRDIFKHQQCDKNGVYLITIPHTTKDLRSFILSHLPMDPKTPEISAMYTYDDGLV